MDASEPKSIARVPVWLGHFVSIAFWVCLGVTSVLFAMVVAAPRMLEWHQLETRWVKTTQQMQDLQAEIRHLELMREALRNDPEFATQIAREELNLAMTAAALSVDSSLRSDPWRRRSVRAAVALRTPWYQELMSELAGQTQLRRRWLWCTALLCVLSFTFLHEGVFLGPAGRSLRWLGRLVLSRYQP